MKSCSQSCFDLLVSAAQNIRFVTDSIVTRSKKQNPTAIEMKIEPKIRPRIPKIAVKAKEKVINDFEQEKA